MKKNFLALALIFAFAMSAQVAQSATWCGCNHHQSTGIMSYISYLNPLPYLGIGENRTSFSLNPFTGFKNCDTCKVKRVAYCNDSMLNTCNTCQKAIIQPKCNSCNREIVQPVVIPRCNSCGR